MQHIPLVPLVDPPKEDKLANRVVRRNPGTYGGSNDPVELEEWIKGMKKIFIVIEVAEEKKVNIGTFYLTTEANIWWSNVKNRIIGPNLLGVSF